MFKMDLSDHYTWPVEISLPSDGKSKKLHFDAHFLRLSQPEIEELMQQAGAGDLQDVEFCNRILDGWKGIQDADGNDFDYSEGNKEILLKVYPIAASIVEAYGKSITDGRRKN